jgi:hypothetical protein
MQTLQSASPFARPLNNDVDALGSTVALCHTMLRVLTPASASHNPAWRLYESAAEVNTASRPDAERHEIGGKIRFLFSRPL